MFLLLRENFGPILLLCSIYGLYEPGPALNEFKITFGLLEVENNGTIFFYLVNLS